MKGHTMATDDKGLVAQTAEALLKEIKSHAEHGANSTSLLSLAQAFSTVIEHLPHEDYDVLDSVL